MQKFFVALLFIFNLANLSAQQIITPQANEKWGLVIQAIEQVESQGNANLVSRDGKYVGCMQISQILVRQCNIIAGTNRFTYNDRFNRFKSHEMFVLFQEHYNPQGDMEFAIRLWNSGDLQCMNHKQRTEKYYQRVNAHLTQLAKQ